MVQTHEDGVTARLHLGIAGVKHAFTTNANVENESVTMSLVDGPFSHLAGTWRFVPLQSRAGQLQLLLFRLIRPRAGRVLAELRFFEPPARVGGQPGFDQNCKHLFVDAFVKRAEQVYSAR